MEKTYKILKLIILILSLVVLILGATRLYNVLTARVQTESIAAGTQTPQRQAALRP